MGRKLLFYTHAFSGGGAETVFARLAQAFAAAGDSVIFAADHAGPLPVIDRANLRHLHLGAGHAASTRRLATLLRNEAPDASFSALGAQNLKHLTAAILAGRRSRCVLGYHGFAAAEPRRLARLSFTLSPLTTRLAARSVCVADALLDDVVVRWGGARNRLVRIYNPLPASTGGEAPRPDDPPLVLALGRLDPVKRYHDLIAAFATGAPRHARLAILGEGPERERLEAEIARHGLHGRASLPGHVADPSPWYGRAACLVIASESESFGLTAAEALAHGLPVVTTACGGPPEILLGLGQVVPVGDTAALGTAIRAALAEPGDPAPRRARARAFALERVMEKYTDVADAVR